MQAHRQAIKRNTKPSCLFSGHTEEHK